MKFEFSAGGIVYKKAGDDFKFVLILNSYDKWTFPKGRIEKKEKPAQAALREVGEEIGLSDLKIISEIGKINYWFRDKKELVHKFVYFYLLEAPENAKLLYQKEEIQDAQWLDFKKAARILGYKKDDLPLLEKSRDYLSYKK